MRPKHVYIMLEHYEMSRSVTTSFLSTHLEHLEGHYYNLCNQEFLHRIQVGLGQDWFDLTSLMELDLSAFT